MKTIRSSIVKKVSAIALTLACSSSLTQAALLAHWSFDEQGGFVLQP